MAWVGLATGMIGILSSGSNWLWGYAGVHSGLENLKVELKRNFEEDRERDRSHERRFERIETSIGYIQKLSTEVEVVKVQLIGISEMLKRVERSLERPPMMMHKGGK